MQPQPNKGTGIKYGDFEARDALIEKYQKMQDEAEAEKQAEAKKKAEAEKQAAEKQKPDATAPLKN